MTTGRHAPTLRTLRVLRELQKGPRTLRQLASRCGVTTRTIRRDLYVLRRSGFDLGLTLDEHAAGTWYLTASRCPVCHRGAAA